MGEIVKVARSMDPLPPNRGSNKTWEVHERWGVFISANFGHQFWSAFVHLSHSYS